jgi:Rod binding domain-containing protein
MGSFATGLSAGVTATIDALARPKPENATADNPVDKVTGAARDFEALLISQILKSVHEEGGWLGSGDDDAGEAAVGLGEEQLARTMSASGGLGLSKLIAAGLRNQQDRETPAATPTGASSP